MNELVNDVQAVYLKSQVVSLMEQAAKMMAAKGYEAGVELANHIHALAEEIDFLREEMVRLNPGSEVRDSFPLVADELEAVVKNTETATETILSSCDNIEAALTDKEQGHTKIEQEITKIIEACSFQDITGQRVSKVVKSVKVFEEHIKSLTEYLETRFPGIQALTESRKNKDNSAKTIVAEMKGPELPGQGLSQEDIDKLLQMMG